jgi:hypothetical protein
VLAEQKTPTSWLGSKYNESDQPAIAHHIWESELPGNLKIGTHVLEVETVDMFNQRFAQSTFFRVV